MNVAQAADVFEIDPRAQFALRHALRGSSRDIVGCYHSHPNGRAEPSPRDLACASEAGFVWLIAAVDPQGACIVNAFLFDNRDFEPLEICGALSA